MEDAKDAVNEAFDLERGLCADNIAALQDEYAAAS